MGSGLIALVFSQAPVTLRKYVQRMLESEGIIVEMEASPDDDGIVVAELSADFAVLASHAEKIGLKKRPREGPPRPFQIQDNDSYEPDATGHIFSESERLMLLWQIIHEIQANENDFEGFEPHQTLMAWLKKNGHLEDYFPLHNAETVDGFLRDVSITRPWLSDDIIERLHDYFGDRIALYFAFLSTYTTCLVTYSFFGAIMFGLSFMPELKPILSLAVAMFSSWWSTWTLQRWYQKNVRLIFDWRGIILGDRTDELLFEKRLVEDIRLEFIGEMGQDEITGKERPVTSPEDASQRGRFSFIVMGLYFIFAAGVIFSLFAFEDVVKAWAADEDDEFVFYKVFPLDLVFQNIPMVVFIVTMMVLNFLFGKLAGKLTYYENHLLKRDHSNSLTGKLTAFQFLNTFGVFLYIAFIRKDAGVLQTRVQNLVVIELIIGNIQETIIPIVLRAFKQQQKVDAAAEKKKNYDLDEKDKKGGDSSMKKYLSWAFVKKLWGQSRKQILPSSTTGVVQTMSVRDQLDLDDAEDNADDDFFEMYKQLVFPFFCRHFCRTHSPIRSRLASW
uniref:Anoctamin transmembrane domain-containing protein n=1 Tax=Rhodosorus marinus TaxID=101924 RepID=A0A7S2ZRN4_9RHOD|mmetsp:Transcript_2893/g.13500  ORF Transcript_2893/g.13500 Transcript_2893/m.13500 type:complete len:559 (+) Transcript_2893:199-1875(+)